MPNTIALAKNYISLIDEVYRRASVTADISSNKAMARAGTHANEIIYPQIAVTGLGDYDRNSGYTTGAVDLKWQTIQFNYDRGTKISVDVMDNEESRNLAFGLAGATLMNEKIAVLMHSHLRPLRGQTGSRSPLGILRELSSFLMRF